MEDRFFVLEVVVDHGLSDTHVVGDLLNTGAFKALHREKLLRLVQNPLLCGSSLFLFLLTGHFSSIHPIDRTFGLIVIRKSISGNIFWIYKVELLMGVLSEQVQPWKRAETMLGKSDRSLYDRFYKVGGNVLDRPMLDLYGGTRGKTDRVSLGYRVQVQIV